MNRPEDRPARVRQPRSEGTKLAEIARRDQEVRAIGPVVARVGAYVVSHDGTTVRVRALHGLVILAERGVK